MLPTGDGQSLMTTGAGHQSERIGLFGGSFNPVHIGHLMVAQAAKEEVRLDRLVFIPAALSPFKVTSDPAPARERLRLLRLALAGKPWCSIDEQELRRGGISYTIDTARDYKQRFPNAECYYLIGADHVRLLSKWRDATELGQLLEFIVIPRPGEPPTDPPPPFRTKPLTGFPVGVSSSEIRRRLQSGLTVEPFLPPTVAEAIQTNHLYEK